MRKILFRGYCKEEKRWVYGDYARPRLNGINHHLIFEDMNGPYVVDPASVCQYTGIKDKNGKLIFEGDILRYIGGYTAPVKWDDEFAGFRYLYGGPLLLEIIGNVYDEDIRDVIDTSTLGGTSTIKGLYRGD